jgi:hypothetical protein
MHAKDHPTVRLQDDQSFPSLHKTALNVETKAFYKTKGQFETFLEDAHNYRDLLVWQSSAPRGSTADNKLGGAAFKPQTDWYDVKGMDVAETERHAEGRLLKDRHIESRGMTANTTSSASRGGGGSRQRLDDNLSRTKATKAQAMIDLKATNQLEIEQNHSVDEITKFETNHHSLLELNDMTKAEVIQLLLSSGIELPGAVMWDYDTNAYKREVLHKRDYVEYCRQQLFGCDAPPVCRRGQKLSKPNSGSK